MSDDHSRAFPMLGWLVGAIARHLLLVAGLAGAGAALGALAAQLEPELVQARAVVQGGLRHHDKPLVHPLEMKERLTDAILDAPAWRPEMTFRVHVRRAEKTNLPTQVYEVDVFAGDGARAQAALDFALERVLGAFATHHAAHVAIAEHQIQALEAEGARLEASLGLEGAEVEELQARIAENSRLLFGTGEVLSRVRTSPTQILARWEAPRPVPARGPIRVVGGGLAGLLLGLLVAFVRGPAHAAEGEAAPEADGVFRELRAFALRYHRLVLSVTVVVVAAALALASTTPPRALARLVVRPAAVATRPIGEIRAVQARAEGVAASRRERGEIPSDVEVRTQVIRQQPPYDIDVSLLALIAEGPMDAALAPALEGIAAQLARTQQVAFEVRRDFLQATLQTQTATLAHAAAPSPSAARHEAVQQLIVDLHRRQRDLSPVSTYPVEAIYGPHRFTIARAPYARYGAFGLTAGLALGALIAAALAGFRAHYRGRPA